MFMSEKIQFNEENDFHFKSREILGVSKTPGMVLWLKNKGIVKDERTAQIILVGVIVTCFGLTGMLLAGGINKNNVNNISPEQQIRELQNDPVFQQQSQQEQQEIIDLINSQN